MNATRISIAIGLFFVALPFASAFAQADDPEMVEYVRRVMYEDGFAKEEFLTFAVKDPALAAYFLGVAAHRDCGFAMPSKALEKASDMEKQASTKYGMKAFAVSVAVSSMKYPTAEEKTAFCASAKKLVEAEERIANQ